MYDLRITNYNLRWLQPHAFYPYLYANEYQYDTADEVGVQVEFRACILAYQVAAYGEKETHQRDNPYSHPQPCRHGDKDDARSKGIYGGSDRQQQKSLQGEILRAVVVFIFVERLVNHLTADEY